MTLVRLALQNYQCFAQRQEVEIRPITVVFGKNNSGKSALVRSPLVIATGMHGLSPVPLDLAELGEDAPDFIDLVHNRLDHGSVGIELEFREPIRCSWTIQNVIESQTQVVSRCRIDVRGESATFTWSDADDTDESEERPYYVSGPGKASDEPIGVRFSGLIPEHDFVRGREIKEAFGEIRHLGPFRARPARLGRLTARRPAQDQFGSRTAEILIHDHVRSRGRLIGKINEYLGDHLPDWRLEVIPRYDAYAVGLKSLKARNLWVSAADSGTGVAQVLPILVQRAQDELDRPADDILEIVEEPELHMHPSAQAALADLYIRAVHKTRVRFLIETHSETFLLRLRRRVAEKRLRADELALYYVESDGEASTVQRVNVDEAGNVYDWPDEIFAENFEEVRAMTEAQTERLDTDAR
jgi:hypothetical protein